MQGFFSRIGWFTVVAVVVSYALFLIAGSIVNTQASGSDTPVLIRDELSGGAHQLSGMVMVPASCDQLSVKTRMLSPTTFSLTFQTWREPSVPCSEDSTPRAFHTVVFAPAAGIYFNATLDGIALPIAVVPIVSGTAQ